MSQPAKSPAVVIPCVIGKYCALHDFVHGGEAEELRKRFEVLMVDGAKVRRADIQRILDQVDARDSVAFLGDQAIAENPDEGGETEQLRAELARVTRERDYLLQFADPKEVRAMQVELAAESE